MPQPPVPENIPNYESTKTAIADCYKLLEKQELAQCKARLKSLHAEWKTKGGPTDMEWEMTLPLLQDILDCHQETPQPQAKDWGKILEGL